MLDLTIRLQSVSASHMIQTPFKRCCITVENSTRAREQKHDLCFHLGQLTACYEATPPRPKKKLPSTLQKTSTSVVNMSAHTSGAHKHRGKSRRWSKSRGPCCEIKGPVRQTGVMSSLSGVMSNLCLQTPCHVTRVRSSVFCKSWLEKVVFLSSLRTTWEDKWWQSSHSGLAAWAKVTLFICCYTNQTDVMTVHIPCFLLDSSFSQPDMQRFLGQYLPLK